MNRLPAFDRTVSRRSSTSIWTALLLAAFVGVVGLVQPVSVVQAAPRLTLVVDRTDDPNPPLVVCAGFANDCSLRGAIITANANPGSTIVLTHGATYTLTIPASGSDDATTGDLNITASTTFNFGSSICFSNCEATIQGGPGWTDHILNIGAAANVVMGSVTIRYGNSPSSGGGIVNSGNLTLVYSTIISNTAVTGGGGIYNTGTLILTSSSVMSNTNTAGSGGGVVNSHMLVISDTLISNNQATSATQGNGGGLAILGGTAVMTNTRIMTNTANTDGGGIYGVGINPIITLTNTSIISNTATGTGGGLYVSGNPGSLTMNGGTVMSNAAQTVSGGGLFLGGINVSTTMNGSSIRYNTSPQGGGIYFSGATTNVSLTNTSIIGNRAVGGGGGGGVRAGGGVLSITGSMISSNSTENGSGGGILSDLTDLNFTGVTFSANRARYGGGAIDVNSYGTMMMTNSTVSTNVITQGQGAGIFWGGAAATLQNSTVVYNDALSGNGAGITIYSGKTLYLKNSLIALNHAPTAPDCYGVPTTQGYNLLGINSGCTGLSNGVLGDQVGTLSVPLNPQIGSYANVGGIYLHPLLIASPAIDAGDPTPSTCPATDQRGVTRPQHVRCDIGAYEYDGPIFKLQLPLILR